MTSSKQQIDSLPIEAQSQYHKLTAHDDAYNTYNVRKSDFEVLKLFLANSKIKGAEKYWYREGRNSYAKLHLNFAHVNHSCASNASNCVLERVEGNQENFQR